MATLQITLDDETFERLKNVAAKSNRPVEVTVEQAVQGFLEEAEHTELIDSLMDEILEEYGEVFDRLAQ